MIVQMQVADTFTSSTWTAGSNCHGGCDQVNAYGVRIEYQSTDYYGIATAQTMSEQTIPLRSTYACPTSQNNNGNESSGNLSTSNRISIGVGLGIGVPGLLLTIWFGCYTQKTYFVEKEKKGKAVNAFASQRATGEVQTSKATGITLLIHGPLIEGALADSSAIKVLLEVDPVTLQE